jgi:hypothetical protein
MEMALIMVLLAVLAAGPQPLEVAAQELADKEMQEEMAY